MKKTLAIVLATLMMASVIAMSAFAGAAAEGIILGTNGKLDFESALPTAVGTYYVLADGENGNHYAKLNDGGSEWFNSKVFKPAGAIEAKEFTAGSKWIYKFEFLKGSLNKIVQFKIGAAQIRMNETYAGQGACVGLNGNWALCEAFSEGWNSVEFDITMQDDGSAKFDVKVNGVAATLVDNAAPLVQANFTSTANYDGIEMYVSADQATIQGFGMGLDDIVVMKDPSQEESGDVKVEYVPAGPEGTVYNFDIAWGSLEYKYEAPSKGSWNADTHKYEGQTEGGWSNETGADTITVTNNSNAAANVSIECALDEAYSTVTKTIKADGNDYTAAVELAMPEEEAETGTQVVFTLALGGTMPEGDAGTYTIGSVTVVIDPVA